MQVKAVIDVEEYLYRFEYIVKRIRYTMGQGKVFIYKRVEGAETSFVMREYDTHNYTDIRLYDTLSLLLDDAKSGAEFEELLCGVLVGEADGVLSVYDLSDVIHNFKAIQE